MKRAFIVIALVLLVHMDIAWGEYSNKEYDYSVVDYYYDEGYEGYCYQVLPKEDGWPYGNHQKMIDSLQIPKEEYEKMSTSVLLDTVLEYPLISDFIAYDNHDLAYRLMKDNFDALRELSKRDDSRECMLIKQSEYVERSLNGATACLSKVVNNIPTSLDENKACRFLIRYMALVFLLNQKDFIDRNNDFVACIRPDYLIKEYDCCYTSNMKRQIMYTYTQYISFLGKSATGSSSIYTPRGGYMTGYNNIAVEYWACSDGENRIRTLNDLSTDAQTAINNEMHANYLVSSTPYLPPSVKYNCHSYAWYSQTNCNYWVDVFSTFNYTSVSKANVNIGGIAVFYDTFGNGTPPSIANYTHSAIITGKVHNPYGEDGLLMRSKWGVAGVYNHSLENCPYYYSNLVPVMSGCDMRYYN